MSEFSALRVWANENGYEARSLLGNYPRPLEKAGVRPQLWVEAGRKLADECDEACVRERLDYMNDIHQFITSNDNELVKNYIAGI